MDEDRVYEKLESIDEKILDLTVQLQALRSIPNLLVEHEQRLRSLEKWQARIIGAYMAAAVLLGVGFQIILSKVF